MTLLSINAGSSSLKVAVFDDSSLEVPKNSINIEQVTSFEDATVKVSSWLLDDLSISPSEITAIGYRVVHGGEIFNAPTLISESVIESLTDLTLLAPNHMPATLATIAAFQAAYPNVPHVACFDTSFFHDLPKKAVVLPIDYQLQKKHGIRRFGFHGLSYESLLNNFRQHEGEEAAKGRVIMAHLGSGASMTVCVDGRPIDTTMGFTPVSGIMMSTRSGDIEPGVLTFLQKQANMSAEEIAELVTHRSGLLGVSGTSAEMYSLLQTQEENPDVALAVELFCDKIKKQLGAFAAIAGGVDSIIFTGGIGERSAEIRARVLSGLDFMGIALDDERNARGDRLISVDGAKVGIHVIPAREESSIARETLARVKQGAS